MAIGSESMRRKYSWGAVRRGKDGRSPCISQALTHETSCTGRRGSEQSVEEQIESRLPYKVTFTVDRSYDPETEIFQGHFLPSLLGFLLAVPRYHVLARAFKEVLGHHGKYELL